MNTNYVIAYLVPVECATTMFRENDYMLCYNPVFEYYEGSG